MANAALRRRRTRRPRRCAAAAAGPGAASTFFRGESRWPIITWRGRRRASQRQRGVRQADLLAVGEDDAVALAAPEAGPRQDGVGAGEPLERPCRGARSRAVPRRGRGARRRTRRPSRGSRRVAGGRRRWPSSRSGAIVPDTVSSTGRAARVAVTSGAPRRPRRRAARRAGRRSSPRRSRPGRGAGRRSPRRRRSSGSSASRRSAPASAARVADGHEQAGLAVADDLADRADVRRHERQPDRAGLGQHHRQAVAERREAEHVGAVVQLDQLRAVRAEAVVDAHAVAAPGRRRA